MVDRHGSNRTRRDILTYGGAAGMLAVAGCISTTDDDGNGNGNGNGNGTDDDDDGNGNGDDDAVYEIGMVDSLTGSLADFGERNQRAKDLALEHVNAVGVGGGELDIIVEDSESESQAGVSAAQKLVNQDNVPFLIGAVGSGVSLSIYESVIQDTDVVQLSQNSTGLGLTDFPGLLRMSPSGRTQSVALADIISEDGYDEVAVTYINDEFGESLYDAFEEAYDGTIAYESAHNAEEASYSSLVSEMNGSDAEAWLCITYQQEFATMVTDMFESGYEPQLYGSDSNRGDTVIANTPEGSMDGMKLVEPAAPEEQDNYQDFAAAFEDEHGESPTAWSAFSYDCVVTAALSIEAADDFTGEALGEVVRDVTRPEGEQVFTYEEAHAILADGGTADDIDYQGVSGPIDFDENGDPRGSLVVFEVQDHDYEAIEFRES
ncbi:ABC transporter substrate-binding protein [Halobacteria archaeon AArc-curdl1]|uniref:ABC transporter substrate-binding protein n=1 Tax=Natronosalvus hydrolyticus TaxID=2979988 RepID=A0AAP2Z7T8_9EURY|nr:ABC transporter substrate-binding protein [Halobacteria archaeon AArc-curdl1]